MAAEGNSPHSRPVTLTEHVVGIFVTRGSVLPVTYIDRDAIVLASLALYRELGLNYWAFDGAYVTLKPGTSLATFSAAAETLARRYPSTGDQVLIADETTQAATIERLIRPQAIALALFALALALTALLIVGQVAAQDAAGRRPGQRHAGGARHDPPPAVRREHGGDGCRHGRRRPRRGRDRHRRLPADPDRPRPAGRAASRRQRERRRSRRRGGRDRGAARRPRRGDRVAAGRRAPRRGRRGAVAAPPAARRTAVAGRRAARRRHRRAVRARPGNRPRQRPGAQRHARPRGRGGRGRGRGHVRREPAAPRRHAEPVRPGLEHRVRGAVRHRHAEAVHPDHRARARHHRHHVRRARHGHHRQDRDPGDRPGAGNRPDDVLDGDHRAAACHRRPDRARRVGAAPARAAGGADGQGQHARGHPPDADHRQRRVPLLRSGQLHAHRRRRGRRDHRGRARSRSRTPGATSPAGTTSRWSASRLGRPGRRTSRRSSARGARSARPSSRTPAWSPTSVRTR